MVSEEKSHRQKEELPMTVMFVNESGKKIKLNRRPSMDVSYQSSVLWPSGFRGKDSNVKI